MENALKIVYGSKYRIPLDHEILRDHDVFYLRALAESLSFEISLAPADQIIVGTDPTSLDYDLTNLEVEYEVVRNTELAREAANSYQGGKMFFFDNHITLHKTFTVNKGAAL